MALVESPRLRFDLSRRHVVRDKELAHALEAVFAAESRALLALGAELQSGRTALPPTFAEAVIKARLRSYADVQNLRPGGTGEALSKIPIWNTVLRTRVSLAALLDQADRDGFIPYADFTLERVGLESQRIRDAGWKPESILLLNWYTYASDAAFLVHHFGDRLRTCSDQILALRDDA